MITEDPLLTAEQRAMVQSLDALCAKVLTDEYQREIDEAARYPQEAMDALAAGGWSELCVREADGGLGASATDLCLMLETIARHSLSAAQAVFSLWIMGGEMLATLGTKEQRARWLPSVAAGKTRIAVALTEPGSGSDAAALRTAVVRDGDEWVVTGQKVFITGAAVSDVIITAVRSTKSDRRQDGITNLLIDTKAPGVGIRKISKLGIKALDLCEVYFDNVRVQDDQVLGSVDEAWPGVLQGLAKERLFLSAISVGALRDVLDRSLEHAQGRIAFGKPIANQQFIGDKLVTMRVAVETGRGLVKQAAQLVDSEHPDATNAACVAKLSTTEAYVSACREGIQIFGGYGFTDEYPISRHYRDCKYLEIGGGTSEIQKIIIGRSLGIRL